jgi:hypothetical protein
MSIFVPVSAQSFLIAIFHALLLLQRFVIPCSIMAFLPSMRPIFQRKSHLLKQQQQQQQHMKKNVVVQDDESLDATDTDVSMSMSFRTEAEGVNVHAVSEISPAMEEAVDTDKKTAKLSPVKECPESKRRKELLLDNMDRFYTDFQAFRKGELALDDLSSEDESDDYFESDDDEEEGEGYGL